MLYTDNMCVSNRVYVVTRAGVILIIHAAAGMDYIGGSYGVHMGSIGVHMRSIESIHRGFYRFEFQGIGP